MTTFPHLMLQRPSRRLRRKRRRRAWVLLALGLLAALAGWLRL